MLVFIISLKSSRSKERIVKISRVVVAFLARHDSALFGATFKVNLGRNRNSQKWCKTLLIVITSPNTSRSKERIVKISLVL